MTKISVDEILEQFDLHNEESKKLGTNKLTEQQIADIRKDLEVFSRLKLEDQPIINIDKILEK